MLRGEPPPYANVTHSGFPTGYFVIRSIATGKVLDVLGKDIRDGAEVVLWVTKEQSLVENMRHEDADNQVFFIDDSGALCSKPSGHALDVQDGHLVLRHRRPVIQPYPNAYSHPLPTFTYDPTTAHIEILFACDPAYPSLPQGLAGSSYASPSTAWQDRTYLLSSIPARKARTIIDHASDFISSTASVITAPLSNYALPLSFGLTGTRPATVQDVSTGEFDLREDEVMEQERAETDEVDDSPEIRRTVLVVGVPGQGKRETSSPAARERRRWEVLPILRERVWTRTT